MYRPKFDLCGKTRAGFLPVLTQDPLTPIPLVAGDLSAKTLRHLAAEIEDWNAFRYDTSWLAPLPNLTYVSSCGML